MCKVKNEIKLPLPRILVFSGLLREEYELSGEPHESELHPSVYGQLHEVAQNALAREAPGHSLQPTLLANDAYLRLVDQNNIEATDRTLVLAAGAKIIRRLLVDYARKRKSQKRGGPEGRGGALLIDVDSKEKGLDVIEVHEALDALSHENERAARVVELKYFGGLTGDEMAETLGVSRQTVNGDWLFAKAWLYRELGR